MEFNKVFLMGNLTRDPESRFLPSGAQVCKLGLASNRRFTVNGEKKEEVLFIDIEAWAKTAELCAQYLRKGSQVLVEGRLKMEQFQTKEGEKRSKLLVVAERVQFGARPDGAQGGGGSQYGGGSSRPASAPAARREAPRSDEGGFSDDMPGNEGMTEDDLPF